MGEIQKRLITVKTTTTMIPHFGLALNTLKKTFLYRISFKPQKNTWVRLSDGLLSHLTIAEMRLRAGTKISAF